AKPFRHNSLVSSTKNQPITLMATADGGAMMNVIDESVWKTVAHRLGTLAPSQTQAKMANSMVIPSQGQWTRQVNLGRVSAIGGFEILDSGGAFEILLGKPWIAEARITQNFAEDTLVARQADRITII
ncbi:hypothetical protein K439DRAFT_1314601, partial [Ramaria rubella]